MMNRLLIAGFFVVTGCTTVNSVPPPNQPTPAPASPPPAKHEGPGDAGHGAPPPVADGAKQGDHPAYLHALSDLRVARALLEKPTRPDVKWDEQNAIREIDAAINEIKTASIDDGKPLSDHPPIDANLKHRDRLHQAMELLHKAAHDVEEHEDNTFAKGLRGRAVGHIQNAEHGVHEAIEDRKEDKHPH